MAWTALKNPQKNIMTEQELKKFCVEIAMKTAANSGKPIDSEGLIKEAKILYDFLKQ